jgi:hypothetical protein
MVLRTKWQLLALWMKELVSAVEQKGLLGCCEALDRHRGLEQLRGLDDLTEYCCSCQG